MGRTIPRGLVTGRVDPPTLFDNPARQRPPWVELTVYGKPVPQGSKAAFPVWRRALGSQGNRDPRVLAVSDDGAREMIGINLSEMGHGLTTWRALIQRQAMAAVRDGHGPLDGPVTMCAVFTFDRPASHYGSGRNRGRLLPSAPARMFRVPDGSKLLRAAEDAVVAGKLLADDARIDHHLIAKTYPGGTPPAWWPLDTYALPRPGAWIRLEPTDG